ncbi:hypothetical protein EVAR_61375_1 [Eumeta japonica]|uniref:Uncharacterized protein n=1 Tax=Eumeta variegata TaxID=151549 RepID=A0A4C1ZA19_EUMVA|nr:hypothetical protein EVAR_61375_1 [Eumeta japonica]
MNKHNFALKIIREQRRGAGGQGGRWAKGRGLLSPGFALINAGVNAYMDTRLRVYVYYSVFGSERYNGKIKKRVTLKNIHKGGRFNPRSAKSPLHKWRRDITAIGVRGAGRGRPPQLGTRAARKGNANITLKSELMGEGVGWRRGERLMEGGCGVMTRSEPPELSLTERKNSENRYCTLAFRVILI